MSMMRKLFRPGKGQVPQRFIAAFVNATTSYRGDVAVWDTTAPTSQGATGVVDGQTLGANDFIFVTICPATAVNSFGLLAGVYEGTHVGDRSSVTNFADDSLAIVQTWGVHENVRTVDDTVAAGALLYVSTTAGACADVAAADIDSTDSTYSATGLVGVSLTADTTYTRGTDTGAYCVTGFVRCDW